MSQENVEIVRCLYSAMNARDVEASTELLHPEAEWISDSRTGQGPIRGRENIIRFFTDMDEMFEEVRIEPERFWETGDNVLVFLRATGSGSASGAAFDIHIGHLWTLRDGVVVRGEGYGNRDEALQAAGLSE
jgi:ketosteroid isomerase-like protein